MKKRLIFIIIAGIILALASYFLFSNSHIEIFPGVEYEYNAASDNCIANNTTIALLDLDNYFGDCPQSKLTATGYFVAILVIGVIPFLLAYLLSLLFIKRK